MTPPRCLCPGVGVPAAAAKAAAKAAKFGESARGAPRSQPGHFWGLWCGPDWSGGAGDGHPRPGTSPHMSTGVTPLPHPSLCRCWGRRGARCGARRGRSARGGTWRWWRARLGAGGGSPWNWNPSRGRYELCPTLPGDLLGDSAGWGCQKPASHVKGWQEGLRVGRRAVAHEGDRPNRGVLARFAGIPQVGVQPGAKPPKFGEYPAPCPRATSGCPRAPSSCAHQGADLSSCPLRAPCAPGVGSGVLSPMGARCHLCPLPWAR